MSYTPNNASIYLAALIGAAGGVASGGMPPLLATPAAYAPVAQKADALAQAVDAAWGMNTSTNLENSLVSQITQSMWGAAWPQTANVNKSSSYAQMAAAIVALAIECNAQVVGEGVDPNTGSVSAAVANITAILANHALANSAGVNLGQSPIYTPVASILNFIMTPGGVGDLLVDIDAIVNNGAGEQQNATVGVKVVPHGAAAPKTVDFAGPATPISDGASLGVGLIYEYGPASHNALVPGNAYDVYLMATSDVSGGVMNVAANGAQLAVAEQVA